MAFMEYVNGVFIPNIGKFITAPIEYPQMIWMTIPLIVIFLVMEFYFARYKRDELGWGSATSNSLVLFFIFIDLIRQIYTQYGMDFIFQEELVVVIPIVVFVGLLGLTLMVMNLFREIPKRVAFFVSSPLTVNYIAYFAIFTVYSKIELDVHLFLSVFVLYLILLGFFWLLKWAFPEAKIAENMPRFRKPLPKLKV